MTLIAAALAAFFVALASLACADGDPPSTTLSSAELPCTPKTTFKKSCNTCVCNTDGRGAVCTKEACPSGYDWIVTDCTPGASYVNDCATCECGPDGTPHGCTSWDCPRSYGSTTERPPSNDPASAELSSAELPCTPKTTFKKSCNTCVCNTDGRGAVCTKKVCPSSNDWFVTACTPGASYVDDCATCLCGPDGTPHSCTSWDCPSSYGSTTLRPPSNGERSFKTTGPCQLLTLLLASAYLKLNTVH